jgi:hypothetical protein
VPVLVAPEGVFADSEEILAHADRSVPDERKLFPLEPNRRRAVEALSHQLDEG